MVHTRGYLRILIASVSLGISGGLIHGWIDPRPTATAASSSRPAVLPRHGARRLSVMFIFVRRLTDEDVSVSFSRSGGAGGQNVNKVATKAELRLDLQRALWIPEPVQQKLRERYAKKVNSQGVLVVTSTSFRTQLDNRKDALRRMQLMLDDSRRAAEPPKRPSTAKVKRISGLKRAENRKRLASKSKQSAKKSDRRRRPSMDD